MAERGHIVEIAGQPHALADGASVVFRLSALAFTVTLDGETLTITCRGAEIVAGSRRVSRVTFDPHARYLSVDDCATYLGGSPKSVRRLVEKSHIPYSRPGGRITFDRVKIDQWVSRAENLRKPI